MMKAAVCYELGKPLVVEDLDLAPPQEGEVKIKVATVAICHSDIHDIKGEMPGEPPFVAGHEVSGYVEELGKNVSSVKLGDPVIVCLLSSCGRCHYCITGLPHLCEGRGGMDWKGRLRNKKGQDIMPKVGIGGFAEYVVVKESQLVQMPQDMPLDRAALLACGFISGFGAVVNRVQVKSLSSVVVIGVGGVGMSAVQGAALSGAYPIIAVDVLDSKLELSRNFGATHTVNAKAGDPVEAVKKLTSGRGANNVFVTVGSIDAVRQGFMMAGRRGVTNLVGLPPMKDTMALMPMEFIASERVITGSFMGSTNLQVDIPRIVALYKAGFIKLDEYITGRYPLEQINEAIKVTESGEGLRNVIMF
jgi:S-(hydroxymethyl)glutathione dehydrogenase/alcohol dehydrogenase